MALYRAVSTLTTVPTTPLLNLLAAQSSFGHYWHKITDRTFSGVYHANSFDLAMMIPYFIVLFILALYGLHRYWLVYDYYKYSKNIPPAPPPVTEWPRVTIQLPIFNERYVIERLVEGRLPFSITPAELLESVLDDSTDETREIARNCVERFAAQGIPIVYIHRTNREGYKAGALENGLRTSQGQFVAIFDADFIPEPDFLRLTIPYFMNPRGGSGIGMVQTRWTYLNTDYSLLTQVETILLDGHFVIEHGALAQRHFFQFQRHRRRVAPQRHRRGRRLAARHAHRRHRSFLSRATKRLEIFVSAAHRVPVRTARGHERLQAQQARWAKGLMQTAKKILPKVFRANVPWHVKSEAFFHLTANISYPLMVLLSTMLLPAMIVRFYQGWFQMLVIDLPLFLASTCSISSFYLVAQKELRPKTWYRTLLYMPFVMATGIGISVRNAQAVIEAIAGKKSEFARTPKYNIAGKNGSYAQKSYRNKAGWMPFAEILLGVYFALTVVYAVLNENYATVPFLLLFVWGYLYTGCMSLGQTYLAHLRFGVDSPEMRPAASGAPVF